jgi:hypothetical protein
MEEELHQNAVCRRFYSTFTANTISKKLLEGFRGFKIGEVIRTIKDADGLVLMAKEDPTN